MTYTSQHSFLLIFSLFVFSLLASPLFAQSSSPDSSPASNENWSSAFGGLFGFNKEIRAMAVSGDAVYVAGSFYNAARRTEHDGRGRPIKFVVQWDGSDWKPLGSGVNGPIRAFATTGTNVYVGGGFTEAGGQSAKSIAKWDGESWEALGEGLNREGDITGLVNALAASGVNVYAGGFFDRAGDQPAANVAKWNGAAWEPLGEGIRGTVTAMAVSGSDLYVAGNFDMAGGQPADGFAKWDGQRWEALGDGFPNGITSIATDGSNVYVNASPPGGDGNGSFSRTGDPIVSRWDGQQWEVLDDPATSPARPGEYIYAKAVAVVGSYVYAGLGARSDNAGIFGVRRWNGTRWEALPWMGSDAVTAMASTENNLFMAAMIGEYSATVAKWDGENWHGLDGPNNGLNNTVRALAAQGNDLYAGGTFTTAGEQWVSGVAKWNGQRWEDLAGGVNGPVHALAVHGDDVYVGGYFDRAGTVEVNSIARWDGRRWHALGNGVTFTESGTPPVSFSGRGTVYALAVTDGDVYVGGSFNWAGGLAAGSIARWDGSAWSALGSGIVRGGRNRGLPGLVYAISTNGDAVYVGGKFNEAGGQATPNFARWDGIDWTPIDKLYSGPVYDLVTNGDTVYVAGSLRYGDNTRAHRAAAWVDGQWVDLPGLEYVEVYGGPAFAVAYGRSGLYVGGGKLTLDWKYNSIARWNGAGWEALGSGIYWDDGHIGVLDGTVRTIAIADAGVYVGGDFIGAGNKSSNNIAFWRTATGTPTEAPPDELPAAVELQAAYPNPFRSLTSIAYRLPEPSHVRLDVYDLIGRRVATLLDEKRPGGSGSVMWQTQDLPSGMYLIRMHAGEVVRTQPVVLLK